MTEPSREAGAEAAQTLVQLHQRLAARRPDEAQAILTRLGPALRRDPRIRACEAYAGALAGRIGPAMEAAKAALSAMDLDVASLDLVGNALTLCHQPKAAHEAFSRAVALEPHRMELLFNKAATARFLGREAEAELALDTVVAKTPRNWAAWRNRSELRTQTSTDNHVEAIERALRDLRPPWQGEVQLCFALGKEYEDLGDSERAFDGFARGARTRRAHMRYDVEDDIRTLARIAEAFDANYCRPARSRQREAGPVFILGLPRTGSTLLEQLLGRHPDIQPLGELQAFGAALMGAVRRHGERAVDAASGKAGLIAASVKLAPDEVGHAYLGAVAPLRDASPFFVDKLPLNYLYAGAIARALPSAAIVHVRRRPADVCLAMFKTLFDEAYPYSYDLAELGCYHNAYARLAAHWREALGPRLIEVCYEDLVGDPGAQTATILAELGVANLESKEVAAAEDTPAPVMTASASQVRKPIHRRSVGSAARYRTRLQPLFEALAHASG